MIGSVDLVASVKNEIKTRENRKSLSRGRQKEDIEKPCCSRSLFESELEESTDSSQSSTFSCSSMNYPSNDPNGNAETPIKNHD